MDHIMKKIINFSMEEDGVTAIEYGLIVVLIAVGIIISVAFMGEEISGFFVTIAGSVNNA